MIWLHISISHINALDVPEKITLHILIYLSVYKGIESMEKLNDASDMFHKQETYQCTWIQSVHSLQDKVSWIAGKQYSLNSV